MFHATTYIKQCILLTGSLLLLATAACTPVQQTATLDGFYSTGQPNLDIRFINSCPLVASGKLHANVDSNTNIAPFAAVKFAIFGPEPGEAVTQQSHVLIGTLPSSSWRWAMETWTPSYTLHVSKARTAGQFWTIQMFPVAAKGDWLSAFWEANDRKAPRFWLAKRWSCTPYTDQRIVAEYREVAPDCMTEALQPLEAIARKEQVSAPESLILWGLCRKEINDFSARADAAVSLGAFTGERQDQVIFTTTPRPNIQPNIKKLLGEAEFIDNSNAEYPTL